MKEVPIPRVTREPPLHLVFETDSTQNIAKKFLKTHSFSPEEKISCEGFVALRQTQGRGRQGRVWEQESQSDFFDQLFLSFAVNFNLQFPTAFKRELLPLAFGFCVYEFLFLKEGFERAPQKGQVFLKWPNDLVYEENIEDKNFKKFGGILVEGLGGNSQFVLGLGLNLRKSPIHLQNISCSLDDIAWKVNANATMPFLPPALGLAAGLQNKFLSFLEGWMASPESVQKKLMENLWTRAMGPLHGRTAKLQVGSGPASDTNQKFGMIQGLAPDGALEIWNPSLNKIQRAHAGDVTIV